MNEIERKILDAQRSHARSRRRKITGTLVLLVLVIIVYLSLTYIGHVRVIVFPSEAAATAEFKISDGFGLMLNNTVWGLKRKTAISVKSPGFESEAFDITDATWKRKKADVILREQLATVRASADPSLSENRWYLDDVLIAQSEFLDTQIEAGEYNLSVGHPRYEITTRELITERGGIYEFVIPLTPVEGEIAITSDPGNARIELDSKFVGTTPLNLKVDGGDHALLISHKGYESRKDTVTISAASKQVSKHYSLEHSTSEVLITFSPQGGIASLDGGAPVSERQVSNLQLANDTKHKIQYSKSGYQTKVLTFTVSAHQKNQYRIQLQPEMGTVHIQSQPVADVDINGKSVGKTPISLELQTVRQNIQLTQVGYIAQTRTVTPKVNSPTSVVVFLETESDYRMKNAPNQYTNSVGIELKLYKELGSFTMGTRRGDIGRRANEFVRKISLTRAFYAGVYEVTVNQVRELIQSGQVSSGGNLPVTNIDWETAAKFCNWLSLKEGFRPVYKFENDSFLGSDATADGYRMLTEAEWEWLARKAGKNKETLFPWGDSYTIPKDSGNLADESAKSTLDSFIPNYVDGSTRVSEVGKYKPNSSGIHDLAGNVSEWTHDSYSLQPPEKEIEIDPFDSGTLRARTIKGSNWRSANLSELRAAWRDGSSSKSGDVGFRIGRYLAGGS